MDSEDLSRFVKDLEGGYNLFPELDNNGDVVEGKCIKETYNYRYE